MSSYFIEGRGWRYDFTLKGTRYTETWFKTKKEANQAEARKREELKNPAPKQGIPTDTDFLTLINRRLDHVKAYNSEAYYRDYCYMAKRWFKLWGKLQCREITTEMAEKFILARSKVSTCTANMEIRCLRACFNFGKKKGLVKHNPVDGSSCRLRNESNMFLLLRTSIRFSWQLPRKPGTISLQFQKPWPGWAR